MDRSIVRRLSVVFILVALGRSSASGTTARPVELEELCRHAHRILLHAP